MLSISSFSDFCANLRECGFSLGGGASKGIFSLLPAWEEQESVPSPIRWHTGDPESDPWEWRMRVLEECRDISYAKVFFKSSGYIVKDWVPFFYSVRRRGLSFEETYENGSMSQMSKRIYDIVSDSGAVALHDLKRLAGISKEESTKFERAMVELQMKFFITMCGQSQKLNRYGEGYG